MVSISVSGMSAMAVVVKDSIWSGCLAGRVHHLVGDLEPFGSGFFVADGERVGGAVVEGQFGVGERGYGFSAGVHEVLEFHISSSCSRLSSVMSWSCSSSQRWST